MSSKSFVNDKIKPKMIKKSTPINGSKLLGKSKRLDLYLYPKYIFNEEEKKRLLKLWL